MTPTYIGQSKGVCTAIVEQHALSADSLGQNHLSACGDVEAEIEGSYKTASERQAVK